MLTGGDAPVSLFMGDLPHEGEGDSLRLEDMLPKLAAPSATDVDPDVLRLPKEGRKKESAFDLRHSPLAAYLYARLGDAARRRRGDALVGVRLGADPGCARRHARVFLRRRRSDRVVTRMSLSSLHEATGRTRKLGRALVRSKEDRTTAQASIAILQISR